MELAENIVPKTNEEISCLCKDNEYYQRACTNFLGNINNSYPKSERAKFIKRTSWVLSCTVGEHHSLESLNSIPKQINKEMQDINQKI